MVVAEAGCPRLEARTNEKHWTPASIDNLWINNAEMGDKKEITRVF